MFIIRSDVGCRRHVENVLTLSLFFVPSAFKHLNFNKKAKKPPSGDIFNLIQTPSRGFLANSTWENIDGKTAVHPSRLLILFMGINLKFQEEKLQATRRNDRHNKKKQFFL